MAYAAVHTGKRKALGETYTQRKVFHSLRHEFVHQLDRAQVPEDRIALLVGHERGVTESFKTYSKKCRVRTRSKRICRVGQTCF